MRRIALLFFALILPACTPARQAGPANAGAQEVVREMMNSYGTMPAFEQAGVVHAVRKGDRASKKETLETRFHMAWKRPDTLELEYGDTISLSARGPRVTDTAGNAYASVDEAIRKLSKASLGVSRLVPSMLLGRGDYPWPEDLWTVIHWVRAEEVNGEPCDVLGVDLDDGGQWVLWVEKARHILRRTSKSGHLDEGLIEVTVDYDPAPAAP
jgi:hypothetical protein